MALRGTPAATGAQAAGDCGELVYELWDRRSSRPGSGERLIVSDPARRRELRDAVVQAWADAARGSSQTAHAWSAAQIAQALDLLVEICGDPIELTAEDRHVAAQLALVHDLIFYDASYAAIATRTGRILLSADEDLLEPGLAVTIGDVLAAMPSEAAQAPLGTQVEGSRD
jgi:predicted nucleic acid-binding protein